jgi:hypothetical protein
MHLVRKWHFSDVNVFDAMSAIGVKPTLHALNVPALGVPLRWVSTAQQGMYNPSACHSDRRGDVGSPEVRLRNQTPR